MNKVPHVVVTQCWYWLRVLRLEVDQLGKVGFSDETSQTECMLNRGDDVVRVVVLEDHVDLPNDRHDTGIGRIQSVDEFDVMTVHFDLIGRSGRIRPSLVHELRIPDDQSVFSRGFPETILGRVSILVDADERFGHTVNGNCESV